MEENTLKNAIWADIFPYGPVLDIMILDFEQKKWRIHYSSLFETELSAETGVRRNRMASIQSQSIFEKITLQKPVAI